MSNSRNNTKETSSEVAVIKKCYMKVVCLIDAPSEVVPMTCMEYINKFIIGFFHLKPRSLKMTYSLPQGIKEKVTCDIATGEVSIRKLEVRK